LKLYKMNEKMMEKATAESLLKFIRTMHPSEEKVQEIFGRFSKEERIEILQAYNEYCQKTNMTPKKEDDRFTKFELSVALDLFIKNKKEAKLQALLILKKEIAAILRLNVGGVPIVSGC
jgi:hypothetical protein